MENVPQLATMMCCGVTKAVMAVLPLLSLSFSLCLDFSSSSSARKPFRNIVL